MEGENKVRMSNLHWQKDSKQRDFLCSFEKGGYCPGEGSGADSCDDSNEVELSLGLSLGGRFGVEKKLERSSSLAPISSLPFVIEKAEKSSVATAVPLIRTSSLPTQMDEEKRRRREMQSLKRLELKRKILERKNSFNSCSSSSSGKVGGGATLASQVPQQTVERDTKMAASSLVRSSSLPAEMIKETMKSRVMQELKRRRIEKDICAVPFKEKMKGRANGISGENLNPIVQTENGNFHAAEVRTKVVQGNRGAEIRKPETGSISCVPTHSDEKAASPAAPAGTMPANCTVGDQVLPDRKTIGRATSFGASERDMMEMMPCVSTTGNGPDGKRIEGFLYNFRKGEELKIVCVCHGSFLSPAEFVRHAGGGDVSHPLRHIVVNSMPSLCL